MNLLTNEEYYACVNSLSKNQLNFIEDIQDGSIWKFESYNPSQIKFIHNVMNGRGFNMKKIVRGLKKHFPNLKWYSHTHLGVLAIKYHLVLNRSVIVSE